MTPISQDRKLMLITNVIKLLSLTLIIIESYLHKHFKESPIYPHRKIDKCIKTMNTKNNK